jgi:hypothetical protein
VDKNKIDLGKKDLGGVDWIGLAPIGRVERSCECWESIEWLHNWWPLISYCAFLLFYSVYVTYLSV